MKIIGEPIWLTTRYGQMGILLYENDKGQCQLKIGQITGEDLKIDIDMVAHCGAKFPIEEVIELIVELIGKAQKGVGPMKKD